MQRSSVLRRQLCLCFPILRNNINGWEGMQELLLSYNIGIDRDVRQRQMIKSTAALVGFKLPDLEAEENSGDGLTQ
jgi:hypothetical protein